MSSNLPTGIVTFVFTDIEGSTRLWERHPEAMKAALAEHDGLLRRAFEARHGYIFKTVGDAFCVAFASPSDALQAALDAQRAMFNTAWGNTPLKVRMGLHTGEAQERDGDYFGPPLNRVARLMSAGHGGQILLSIATQDLVRDQLPEQAALVDLGEHRLKDLFRPEHVYQLRAPGLPAEFPPLRSLDIRLTNLPAQVTPFIGRERELAAVLGLLRDPGVRLVTLVGPGGTGKTRLCLQAAAALLDEYEHGVWFVDLSAVTNPDLVSGEIAHALSVREVSDEPLEKTLLGHLCDRALLLVLDNYEQVMAAAPVVSGLLAGTSHIQILVTSREVLRVSGEHSYPVPPLALPDLQRPSTTSVISQYEAVALFIQRAKAIKPVFDISDENALAVAEICVRLDGLPLAIELAAARVTLFVPQQLLQRLADRFRAVGGGLRDLPARQRTLRGTIDWSYDLLDEAERRLFARLAVFQGGRTLTAAEAVCGPDLGIDVVDGLQSLIQKSLLKQVDGGANEPRFVMLETIQEYARERLVTSGEAEALRRRHAEYFAGWVEQMALELRAGPTQLKRFEQLEAEQGNLDAALEWLLGGGDGETGLRLIGAVFYFWWRVGHWVEWGRWMGRVPAHQDRVSESARAAGLVALGAWEFYNRRDLGAAQSHLQEALALYRRLGDQRNTAYAILWANASSFELMDSPDEYARAVMLTEEAVSLLRQAGDLPGIAQALNNLGLYAHTHGDRDRAKTAYQEALEIARASGDQLREHIQYANLGIVALEEGDYETALLHFNRSLEWAREHNSLPNIHSGLLGLASLWSRCGQPGRAARLIGASDALSENLGVNLQPTEQSDYDHTLALTRQQLGEGVFQAMRAEGWAMGLEKALEYALAEMES